MQIKVIISRAPYLIGGPLCTRTRYAHTRPCPPPTEFILKKLKNKNALNKMHFFLNIFLVYERQVGIGERGHEVDSYLLDNRNRTQKWDE